MILGELFIPSRDCKLEHETIEDEEDRYCLSSIVFFFFCICRWGCLDSFYIACSQVAL